MKVPLVGELAAAAAAAAG